MVGTLGWALIFAAMTAWEGLSLSLGGKQWPTMSDMARAVTRPVWGRWMFFALWLWFGWHYFMRGWTFPLRGHAPGGGDGGLGHPKGIRQLLTEVVLPMVAIYGFILAALALAHSSRLRRTRSATGATGYRPALTRVTVLIAGGYGLFVAVTGCYQLIAGSTASGLVRSAAADGEVLAFGVALPAFVILSVAEQTLRHLIHRRRHGQPPQR